MIYDIKAISKIVREVALLENEFEVEKYSTETIIEKVIEVIIGVYERNKDEM